ncbi:inter-alpha-trypsin inhibitor heavy chain H3-like [Dendropsophus ebraccatus]|uniref:inter-alpha-trypsin inhibitor heavy chain H3-like n=1 Tax=Dendropsophus ebraccatus TaxID=150705 RepID=UPI003831F180
MDFSQEDEDDTCGRKHDDDDDDDDDSDADHKRSIKTPDADIEVYSIIINSQVTSRFAHNVITSRAVNNANVSKEAIFDVDLPKTAFITHFSMIIDEVTYTGVIKEKEAALEQYQQAVSKGQTAGLVRASGRNTERFSMSVNVAPESEVTFELVYEEMLKRRLGKYEIVIKVQPKTLIRKYEIKVDIQEPQGISFLNASASFLKNDLLPAVEKSFYGDKGHVSFKPTIDQQRSCANCETTLLDGDFTVTYDVNRESPGNIQIVNGYFVHFFAPPKLPAVPKNVVYVIDRSGSMTGNKIKQTREALLRILRDTPEHDYFNFIQFDNEIIPWKPSLVEANEENINQAEVFVSGIYARGLTNINDAVLKAVELLDKAHRTETLPPRSASIIILLTDGQPTVGETNAAQIEENVKKAIQGRYTLYTLGFGYDVDYPLLEKLALQSSGIARRIYEDSDADLQLQGFYKEIANPTLTNIEMQYPENAVANLTENNFKQYFEGGEIVVAGRVTGNDLNSFIVDVKADGAEKPIKYTENIPLQSEDDVSKQQKYIFGDFTERLWAYLTIQQLLEKRLYADPSEAAILTTQALDLSLKFKFVTPLTSMVVTRPERQGNEDTLIADKFVEGQDPHATGGLSFPSFVPPFFVDSDPHFVINVPQKNDSLCFNIQEKPGVILNLIQDRQLGIAVNGQLIGNKKTANVTSDETYFGRIGIVNRQMKIRIEVTTDKITVLNHKNKTTFSWQETGSVMEERFNLVVSKKDNVTFSFGEGATFVIILHEVWKRHPLHRDFLGFYTLDDHKFSTGVHGLLGQFFHGIDYEISNVHKTDNPDKPDATMKVKNKMLTVTRGAQKDYRKDHRNGIKVPCWFVHNNGKDLIDGNHADYIVSNIFRMFH